MERDNAEAQLLIQEALTRRADSEERVVYRDAADAKTRRRGGSSPSSSSSDSSRERSRSRQRLRVSMCNVVCIFVVLNVTDKDAYVISTFNRNMQMRF